MTNIHITQSDTGVKFHLQKAKWIQALLTDPETRTPAATRNTGVLLVTMCRPDQPYAYPSNKWIAEKTGHGRRSVERAVAHLRETGYIRIVSGGIASAGGTFTSRYYPNFEKINSFEFLTGMAAAPSPLAVRTVSTGGSAPSPLADESVRMSAPLRAAEPPPLRTDGFNNFMSVAREYRKEGDAGARAIEAAYKAALAYEGVTPEALVRAYRSSLEAARGRKYTGHFALKFLQTPTLYVGGNNEAERSTMTRNANARSEPGKQAQKPEAVKAEDWAYICAAAEYYGTPPDELTNMLTSAAESDYCRKHRTAYSYLALFGEDLEDGEKLPPIENLITEYVKDFKDPNGIL